jgi:peptidoglycan DL-endopeptidase CwlO
MYLDSGVTPLEELASSSNLSDFVTKQQYRDNVQQKIITAMATITELQKQLDIQKKQTADLLNSLNAENAQVQTLQQQAASLLATAQLNAGAADAQVRAENAQIANLQAQEAASFAKLYSNGSGSSGYTQGSLSVKNISFGGACSGGYPSVWCNAPTDQYVDSWGLYSRECVSYAAWAMSVRSGNMPYVGGYGNAYQWPGNSKLSQFPQNNDPNGAAVVMIMPQSMIGGVGHAAVVESVNGGWVHISQYNWWPTANGPYGLYSTMDIKLVPGLIFIHFK